VPQGLASRCGEAARAFAELQLRPQAPAAAALARRVTRSRLATLAERAKKVAKRQHRCYHTK